MTGIVQPDGRPDPGADARPGNCPDLGPNFRPDFQHVRCWIFDLDNTLYRADNGIFAQIERRMTAYVMRLCALPHEAAWSLQKDLYRRYGTTLNGLMAEHGCDAEDYLRFVHDIDLSGLPPDPGLQAALAGLPGRRFVFTNGCRDHAGRILARLGMEHLFDAVWDIRTIGFRPKPQACGYAAVLAASGFRAQQAAMFDDIAPNLVPARALGMTTVWLKHATDWSPQGRHGTDPQAVPDNVDHQTDNLVHFLHNIRTTS